MKIVKEIVAFVQTEYDKNCQSFVGNLHLELPKSEKYHFAWQFYWIFMETDQKKKTIVVYFSE